MNLTYKYQKYFIGKNVREGFNSCTVEEVVAYCRSKKIITLDTETTGLDPFSDSVIMLQIGDLDKAFALDSRAVDITPLKQIIEDQNIIKLGVNIRFDAKMLVANYGIRPANLVDIGIVERVLHTTNRKTYYSMSKLASKYLNLDLDSSNHTLFPDEFPTKATRSEFIGLTDEEFTPRQINYGLLDVFIPLAVYNKQIELIKEEKLLNALNLETKFTEVVYTMEHNGMYVDQEKWLDVFERNTRRSNWKLFVVKCWLHDNGLEEFADINWRSSRQVVKLFKVLKIPTEVIDRKKSRGDLIIYKDSIEEKHISQFKKKYPFVPIYLELKKYLKFIDSFGDKFLRHVHPVTGRIHTEIYQILVTGRISSSKPNLQQIPGPDKFNKAYFRDCFVPQAGRKLVVADFSSQEVRTIASKANIKALIEFYQGEDDDVHSLTARKMFKVHVSKHHNKHLRQRAKILQFATLYGASPYMIAKAFDITVKEAQEFVDLYMQAYPELYPYFAKQKAQFMDTGSIIIDDVTKRKTRYYHYDTFKFCRDFKNRYESLGWKKYIPAEITRRFHTHKGNITRDSQNYPIQGLSASMTKLSAILVHNYIRDNDLWDEIKIIMLVHDEIILEVTTEYKEIAAKLLEDSMIKAGKVFCPAIPMKVDVEISDVWTH